MKILNSSDTAEEFERCCREFSTPKIACAWCGDPALIFPYSHLNSDSDSKRKIQIITGISFNQTHPDSIKFFIDNDFDLRIFRAKVSLFHPKIYLFTNKKKFALFIGSSNFTYSGFHKNIEINQLTEGELIGNNNKQVKFLEASIDQWRSEKNSFSPTQQWLKKYTKAYNKQRKKEKDNKIQTPSQVEDLIPRSNWLSQATWSLYYKKVIEGLKEKERNEFRYADLLNIVAKKLPIPWKPSIFDDIENRRIIGGMGEYGWLGHVAASGAFRKLMANGSTKVKRTTVTAINNICSLSFPLDMDKLDENIADLLALGPTIKVWSRIFTIIRPDLFCTVASPSVRTNLSKTLEIPKSQFETSDGYIKLLQLVHSCPWFNAPEPRNKKEELIWARRVAFMDAIFVSSN